MLDLKPNPSVDHYIAAGTLEHNATSRAGVTELTAAGARTTYDELVAGHDPDLWALELPIALHDLLST